MRNTIRSKPKEKSLGDIRAEYHFDYSKSKPNRFAKGAVGAVTIVLDPDVAKVFKNARSVNEALRTLIANLPPRRTPANK
jgi:hypothetical protein